MGKTYRRNSDYRPKKGNGRNHLDEITRLKKKGKRKGRRFEDPFGAPAAGFPPSHFLEDIE